MAYKINTVHWQQSKKDIKHVREKVFVCEFHIPPDCEFDAVDSDCEHVLIKDDDGNTIATGRICQSGKISRIAVLMQYRQTDAGKRVIEKLIDIARAKGLNRVFIDSEQDQISHFKEQGFMPVGQVFMQAGVAKQSLSSCVKQFHCPQSILH